MKPVIAILAAIAGLWGTAPAGAAPRDDASFGPRIVIEDIEVRGNAITAERIILRALMVEPGDSLRAGDPRLKESKFKVLALGFFRSVELEMRKGSERGQVVLVVTVQERGTVVLNRLYFGTTEATPYWAGLDLGDRNFLGTGINVGGAFIYAGESDVNLGDSQWAAQLRVGAGGLRGTPFGLHGSFTAIDATEPYRVRGPADEADPNDFDAFSYERLGFKGGGSYDLTALSHLALDLRVERVEGDVPASPARLQTDGSITHVDLALRDGESWVSSLSLGFDRDTRPDPILPFTGNRITVIGELGATWLGGDYNFSKLLARYEHWWPVRTRQHVLSVHLTGGLVLGNAPLFDRFYVGDLNRMLTPRELGLILSTRPSLDLLGTAADDATYGELAGLAEVQYAYRLFRRGAPIYGGDLFVSAGAFGLARRDDFLVRDESLFRALPIDLVFDVGLRFDTEIGIFELAIANGFGRVPL